MSFVPRLRIGQRLGASTLGVVGSLDEIRLSVGASRDLSKTQTAPWPNPLEADTDVADTGWVDIVAHKDGQVSQPKRFTVTRARKGQAGVAGNAGLSVTGPRGNVNVAKAVTGSTWTDAQALAALTEAGYGSPINRDIVTLYNNTAGFSETRFYNGAAWLVVTQYLNGNLFVTGTVTADHLNAADGTFTGNLVAAGGTFSGNLSAAGGTFSGNLSAARISVGLGTQATQFFDAVTPSVSLNSTADGLLTVESIYTDQVVYTTDDVLFKNGAAAWAIERRIRSGLVKFFAFATASVDDQLSVWYRVDGGAWIWVQKTSAGGSGDTTGAVVSSISLTITNGQTVQFGVTPTDRNLQAFNMSKLYLKDCSLLVQARNF